jgi:hypothetical protein
MAKQATPITALAPVSAPGSLAKYEPVIRSMAHIRTVADALDAKTDSIGAMVRRDGSAKVEDMILKYLILISDLVNVKRPLTDLQSQAISIEVVSGYKFLTLADIHLIFRRVLAGEYGELYESIDMPKVMGWFRKYADERTKVAFERNERESERYRNSYTGSDDRTGKAASFRKIVKSIQPSISIKI